MSSLTCFNVRFTPGWLMVVLAGLFFLLFVRLGYWQLHRADEKQKMLAAEAALAKREPEAFKASQNLPIQYQRIKVEGHYLPNVFFLDNQHHDHQFGYNVLTPLLLAEGKVVMVDRGWVPGDNTRQSFPEIKFPEQLIQLQGSVYIPNKNQLILGPSWEEKENKVILLERMDFKLLSQILQKKLYPFIIRLDRHEAYGFIREWAIVSMPPQRHLAYALQWFVMALVILILFVALNLKKKNEKTS